MEEYYTPIRLGFNFKYKKRKFKFYIFFLMDIRSSQNIHCRHLRVQHRVHALHHPQRHRVQQRLRQSYGYGLTEFYPCLKYLEKKPRIRPDKKDWCFLSSLNIWCKKCSFFRILIRAFRPDPDLYHLQSSTLWNHTWTKFQFKNL